MSVGHACCTTQVWARHHAEVGRRGQQGGKVTGVKMAAEEGLAGTGGILPRRLLEGPGSGYGTTNGQEAIPHHRM